MNILFHTCCSNCAVYPFELVKKEGHGLTGLWFNPNIHPLDEYSSRLQSLKKLAYLRKMDILFFEDYRPEEYFDMFGLSASDIPDMAPSPFSEGLAPSSPERCRRCYELRLGKTAEEAAEKGFDAFSTTLLISPYQDFEQIGKTGKDMAERFNIEFYMMDFRPFFRDSMAVAKALGMYRQKYCGCIFSNKERQLAQSK